MEDGGWGWAPNIDYQVSRMPQYEITNTGSGETITLVRAKSAEAAIRSCLPVSDEAVVELESERGFDSLSGWRKILVDGEEVGCIRLFQRMKFRRA